MEQPFTIRAGPDTDIWKKPPTKDIFNAPFKPHSSNPAASFRSAQVTFAAAYARQYDQAGLLLRLTPPAAAAARKWVKTGIELYGGLPRLSTVSCDAWADWSVGPVDGAAAEAVAVAAGARAVTVRVRAEGDANGRSWWVYRVGDDGAETPLREICWVADARYADWTLEVAAMAARPAKDAEGELEASFEEFTVEWA